MYTNGYPLIFFLFTDISIKVKIFFAWQVYLYSILMLMSLNKGLFLRYFDKKGQMTHVLFNL